MAELVAAGRANREVATELFMSVRTVEGHLGRVYGKLDIRGRSSSRPRWPARADVQVVIFG